MLYAFRMSVLRVALTTSNRPPSNRRMLVFALPLRFCRIDATSNEIVDWLNGVATSGAVITSNKTSFPKTLSIATALQLDDYLASRLWLQKSVPLQLRCGSTCAKNGEIGIGHTRS